MAIVGAASNIKCYTVKLAVDSKANKNERIEFLEGKYEYDNSDDGPILYVRYNSIPNNLLYIGECAGKHRVINGFYSQTEATSLNLPAANYNFRKKDDFKIHYVDVYQLDPSIYGNSDGNSDEESKSDREKLEQYVRKRVEILTGQRPKFNNDPNSKNFPRHIIDTGNQIICDMMQRGIINTKCITEER